MLAAEREIMIKDTEKAEIENLERSADEFLSNLAESENFATKEDLQTLAQMADRTAKIAFGSDCADLLSEQLQNLIRWTDHENEQSWVENFKNALRIRPLAAPW